MSRPAAKAAAAEGAVPASLRLGPYRLIEKLSEGGMGQVWRACRERGARGDREEFAIKVVLPDERPEEHRKRLKRFEREARLSVEIRHPGFVHVHELGHHEEEGREYPYLVMELVRGRTLSELVAQGRRLSEPELLHVGRQVAAALSALHARGIYHRDVTPRNVMWTEDDRVKLIDLGLGLEAGSEERLTTRGVIGTRAYMSPEHFLDNECEAASDLYSLGATLYFAAAGRPPHEVEQEGELAAIHLARSRPRPLGERRPDLSPFLEACIDLLLEHDPRDRFGSAGALAATLGHGEGSRWWRQLRARRERRGATAVLRRLRPIVEGSFVGREAELERLEQELAQVESEGGRLVVLQGEAGAGKTALLARFLGSLEHRSALQVLHGRALDVREGSPASAFAEGVREWLGGEPLEAHLRRRGDESVDVRSVLGAFLRGERSAALEGEHSVEQLRAGFAAFAKSLAADELVVWAAEDLHAGSVLDRLVLETLLPLLPGLRLLLVVTTRPDHRDSATRRLLERAPAGRLEPGALSRREVELLLHEHAEARRLPPPPPRVVSAVHVRTGGHPLFVAVLAAALDGSWTAEGADAAGIRLPLPRSLSELVQARLDDLGEDDAWLLQLAAVAGATFDAEVLADLEGRPALSVLRALSRIGSAKGLVRAEGRLHRFEHELVREALLERMDEPLRLQCHEQFARLAERGLDRGEAREEGRDGRGHAEAARHWLEAGRFERAEPHLIPALDLHESCFEHEALDWLAARALELAPGSLAPERLCQLHLRRASSLLFLERRQAAAATLQRAVAAAEEDGSPALQAFALRRCAQVDLAPGRHARAVQLLERARSLAATCADSDLRMEIDADLIHAAGRAGDPARAREVRGLSLERPEGSARARARLLGAIGYLHYREEEFEAARGCLEEALTLARQARAKALEAYALSTLHLVERAMGSTDEAARHCEEHARLCAETGFRSAEARACANLGALSLTRGDTEAAERHYRRQIELCRELGSDEEVHGTFGIAVSRLWRGRLEGVEEQLERTLAVYERLGDAQRCLEALLTQVQLKWMEGRLEEAMVSLRRAEEWARSGSLRRLESAVLCWRARLEQAAAVDQAWRRAERALELAEGVGAPREIARSALVLGRCLQDEDASAAERALARAATECRRHGLLDPGPLPAALLCVLGRGDPTAVLVDEGSPAEVRMEAWHALHRAGGQDAALDRAFEIACGLAAHLPWEEAQRLLLSNPVVRRIVEDREALGD